MNYEIDFCWSRANEENKKNSDKAERFFGGKTQEWTGHSDREILETEIHCPPTYSLNKYTLWFLLSFLLICYCNASEWFGVTYGSDVTIVYLTLKHVFKGNELANAAQLQIPAAAPATLEISFPPTVLFISGLFL